MRRASLYSPGRPVGAFSSRGPQPADGIEPVPAQTRSRAIFVLRSWSPHLGGRVRASYGRDTKTSGEIVHFPVQTRSHRGAFASSSSLSEFVKCANGCGRDPLLTRVDSAHKCETCGQPVHVFCIRAPRSSISGDKYDGSGIGGFCKPLSLQAAPTTKLHTFRSKQAQKVT